MAVVRSAEGNTDLVACLICLHSASAGLYDFLMAGSNADSIQSEEALEQRDETIAAKAAAEAASTALADRLNRLYDTHAS